LTHRLVWREIRHRSAGIAEGFMVDIIESSVETPKGRFEISTDPARIDVDAVHAFITRSYWAAGIGRAIVARSIAGSLCFGLNDPTGGQAGFARLITDGVTFAYLADVYVLEEWRGLGLGKALTSAIVTHPVAANARRVLLATADAQSLYAQHGFKPLARPGNMMEISRPDIYRAG
jgi:GNAT superfamily N-acetyltransferase